MSDAPVKGYKPIPLYSIIPDEVLPFTIWVFYGGRMIRYRPAGEVFEGLSYNRFICKQITEVFIRQEDAADYKAYASRKADRLNRALNDPTIPQEQKEAIKIVYDLEAVTQELFLTRGAKILDQNLFKAARVARAAVEAVCAMPYLRVFDWVPSDSQMLIDHSIRTSLLAVFLGYQLGHVQKPVLEQLAMAGMLHDVGKTRIPLSDDLEKGDEAELRALERHPLVSREMLEKSPHVPEEVLKIIVEHHENHNGTGYPFGIRGSKMDRPTRIFAIANTYDNLVSALRGSREHRRSEALHLMKIKHRRHFDPEILPKVLRLLAP